MRIACVNRQQLQLLLAVAISNNCCCVVGVGALKRLETIANKPNAITNYIFTLFTFTHYKSIAANANANPMLAPSRVHSLDWLIAEAINQKAI